MTNADSTTYWVPYEEGRRKMQYCPACRLKLRRPAPGLQRLFLPLHYCPNCGKKMDKERENHG